MNKTAKKGTLIRRAADIVASEMDGEYLIMSIELGSYIALRDVSARIWELLEQPQTLASLLEDLLREYTVDPDICEREVNDFLKEMDESRLITLEDAG
jgi:hypothetical protein